MGEPRCCDLVIFDCDGVLIDSEPLACRIDAEELTACGFPISAAEVARRFTGVPANEMRTAIEAEWGRPLPPGYEPAVAARIERAFRIGLEPLPGVPALLAGLAMPRCVASSSAPAKLRLGLEVTGLLDLFEPDLFSAAMVARGKPAPDLFLFAAERMGGISPARTVVIEDSLAGVQAGVAAGMTVIGFLGGSHCPPGHADTLSRAGAASLVRSHAELAILLR